MAYTAIPTITTGDVATAAWGNTYLKDNFAAGVPDIFTTDGDMAVGTGANAAERVAVMNASNLLKHETGGLELDISGVVAGDGFFGSGTGSVARNALVTQGQAEAGSDTTPRPWTALRVKQAIDALSAGLTEATQSDMEDEGTTNANRYVSPEVTKFAPSAVKAWVLFRHATTIDASYNITSITSNGNADYTITIATDFSSVSYAKVIGGGDEDRMLTTDITVVPAAGTYDVHNAIMSNASTTNVSSTAGLGSSVVFLGDQ
jgi:hypothetical protein